MLFLGLPCERLKPVEVGPKEGPDVFIDPTAGVFLPKAHSVQPSECINQTVVWICKF